VIFEPKKLCNLVFYPFCVMVMSLLDGYQVAALELVTWHGKETHDVLLDSLKCDLHDAFNLISKFQCSGHLRFCMILTMSSPTLV
jgi:hypothetical protein